MAHVVTKDQDVPVTAAERRNANGITAAGLAAWLFVALPTVLSSWRSPVFTPWAVAWVVFGVAFVFTCRRECLDAPMAAGLALEGAAVVALVTLLCNGFEGMLLVVVAAQLGRVATLPGGIAWLVVQTLAAGAGIAFHWSRRPAFLLMPPYLGFQLFAFFTARLQASLAAQSRLAERLRIARELHDALGHHLTALALNLEVAAHQTSGDAHDNVRMAQSLARLLLGDVRDLVHSMKEDEAVDLEAGLHRLVAVVPTPEVHVDVAPGCGAPDPRFSHALLRCAQEFVTNSIRHAGARNVWIEIRENAGALELTARDDGRGAPELRAGDGLSGMRERLAELGGTLDVESAGEGFLLRATVPGLPARVA
jgi:signal transduction histidine kinase